MTDYQALDQYATHHDAQAFRLLVENYQRLVYAAARRRLAHAQDIEDVVQLTFLKLAKAAGTIRRDLSSWLYTTAINTANDLIRDDATRRRHEALWGTRESANLLSTAAHSAATHALETEEWHKLSSIIDEALLELPPDQQFLLIEHFFRNRSQRDLAAELQISRPTILRRVQSAVDALRARLAQHGFTTAPALLPAALPQFAQAQVPTTLTTELTKIGLGGPASSSAATAVAASLNTNAADLFLSISTAAKIILAVAALVLLVTTGILVAPRPKTSRTPAIAVATSSVAAKTLDEKLWDIGLLQDGKNTPFQKVEAITRPLFQEYRAPEEQAKIYYFLALIYAQSGPVYDGTIRNAKAALDLPLDPAKRLQLFVYWGDAIQVEHAGARGNDLIVARRDAAHIYFRGLKECIDNEIPRDKPAVPTWLIVNSDGPETDESRRLRSEIDVKLAAKAVALIQIAMIEQRDTLMNQIIYMYSRFPFATDELEASAKEALGNSWMVGELVDMTKAEIKKRVDKSGKTTAPPHQPGL